MPSSFKMFKNKIDEAVAAIEDSSIVERGNIDSLAFSGEIIDTDSLLDRCESICDDYENNEKPVIRVIQHLACTGGTVISKCISALPNVYLLSEVHPNSDLFPPKGKAIFLPSDISSLAKFANIPNSKKLSEQLFLDNILAVSNHVNRYGGTLVLREHTHSDFHVGNNSERPTPVISILSEKFQVKSILSMRDPIDSYLSLLNNGWLHFSPSSFEEYCERIGEMLKCYDQTDIVLYEDFIEEPEQSLKSICAVLDLNYSEFFIDLFSLETVTGDSGRSAGVISKRKRREVADSLKVEIEYSKSYQLIKEKFGY
jgi:hypothetical protein